MSFADSQWCPASVQVTVLQARGLRSKGKSGTNDAYAVMQVGKEKFQTSVVEKSVAPVWKEEATFDLPQSGGGGGGGKGTLHVHVLHRALVGPDKQLGHAVVDLLCLSEDKTRNKTEWFKLLDKTGKADKDRGEVLLDIQFLRNNMTASMFDLSAAGKSRSRLGKFKDKVRGKKKESDTVSGVVPSFTQVLTDSEEEANDDDAAGRDEKKKKHKMKLLFSSKSNLQRNMSQSMSVLPGKTSSLSRSQSSGLNVDSSEGKKKFKFMIHKRLSSSDGKDSSSGHQKHGGAAEQSNLCINGSHVYCDGSNFSLSSSGHGSMEDVPGSSPPSVNSLKAVTQYSPWTEEEEEEEEETAEVENITEDVDEEQVSMEKEKNREEERMRTQEEALEKMAEEKRRQEEEEIKRIEEEKVRWEEEERARREEEHERLAEEKRRLEEQERKRIEEEERQREARIKKEGERRRLEEERQLAQEARRKEEESRAEEEKVRKEEEEKHFREEERRRREEEEKAIREEVQERARLAEEKRRLEEQERMRIEEEERIRMEEESRREEEHQLAEENRRMEEMRAEEDRVRKEEGRRRKEEEEMVRRQEEEEHEMKRKLEEEERRWQEEQEKNRREEEKRLEEEERARKEREEHERLVREEKERERIEAEEQIKREVEERIRMEDERRREERERVKRDEEEKRLEEQERRRIEEDEKRQREEEERRRQEEEDRVKKEKEESERLAEEKRRAEEQERKLKEQERIRKEERRRRREEEEMERLAEEKRRREELEKHRIEKEKIQMEEEQRFRRAEKEEEEARKLIIDADEPKNQSKTKHGHKSTMETSAVAAQSAADVTSTNPFDEHVPNNPLEDIPRSPAAADGNTAMSGVQQGCQIAVSLEGDKSISMDEKNLSNAQREKRPAPPPPGRNTVESRREQDVASQHLAPNNKQSNDRDVKTASVLPQRSVQFIAPLSQPRTDAKTAQNLTQSSPTKGTEGAGKHGKRVAPPRPRSAEEEPSSETKGVSSSRGNTSQGGGSQAKRVPVVRGSNPFEDDEDELTLRDDIPTPVCDMRSTQRPPPVSRATDESKLKSSKVTHAPPPPPTISSTLIHPNTDSCHAMDTTAAPAPDKGANQACGPQPEATLSVQNTSLKEPARSQSTAEVMGVKKEAPPTSSRRLLPVRPLNPLEQKSDVSIVQGGKSHKSIGIFSDVQEKTKIKADSGLKGPYSQLTREELVSLLQKQENQMSVRDKKISELEQYIDKLLVRVMEEKPSILMSMNSLK